VLGRQTADALQKLVAVLAGLATSATMTWGRASRRTSIASAALDAVRTSARCCASTVLTGDVDS
jgi:hypothetical protein